jgi:hypothetical protein
MLGDLPAAYITCPTVALGDGKFIGSCARADAWCSPPGRTWRSRPVTFCYFKLWNDHRPHRARPVGWSLADEAQLLEVVSEAGFVSVTTMIMSLQTKYPSARPFVEILLKGSSKVAREELAQIPTD